MSATLQPGEAVSGDGAAGGQLPPWGDRLAALLAQALREALPPWSTIQPTLIYCVRTLAAIAIALYASFALQLQAPLSSVTTVLIVANPVTGALVSKSLWRLFGTFVGAAGAVFLMAMFAQSPVLYGIVFSIWIGLACIASTLLRFFKAYGAVLAGYTIVIVSGPAFADPEHIFISALSRVSAVSVGIASAAAVFLLTSLRPPSRLHVMTRSLVQNVTRAIAHHASPTLPGDAAPALRGDATPTLPGDASPAPPGDAAPAPPGDAAPAPPGDAAPASEGAAPAAASRVWNADGSVGTWRQARPGRLSGEFYGQRGTLLMQANAIVEIIEYAAADSYKVARRVSRLRLGAAGLTGALTALNPFYGRLGQHEAIAPDVYAAIEGLGSAEQPEPALHRVAALRDRIEASFATMECTPADLDHLGTLEHAHDLLSRLHAAVSRLLLEPAPGSARGREVRLRLFLDWPTALRNGARGAIVTMLAFIFWYMTQWPSGPTLLGFLVPASCLLATNPSASRASIDFAIGSMLAIPGTYICQALMLPRISDFPLLLAAMGSCLLPGIWFQFHPRYGLRAFGYVVFFNAMLTVRNPITFDDIGLLNTWLAFAVGAGALIIVFRALLPPNPQRDANRLVHSITRAVARLGRGRFEAGSGATRIEVWESLQMQKALRLIQRLQPMPAELRHELTDCAMIAIELGRNTLRLRQILQAGSRLGAREKDAGIQHTLSPSQQRAARAALSAMRRLRREPARAASLSQQAALLLIAPPAAAAPGEPHAAPQTAAARRIAALLHENARLIRAIPEFLSQDYAVPKC